ncbi:syntaxin-11-like [Poeciliopsis prolifica]|uniref:syntaxin-11-like n=1 Tax=Poeciliopsis prolifica TaxID=188132 RepID=UPI0024145261|nr:syntaxin-11-like [Poeciliopsis prolifica]
MRDMLGKLHTISEEQEDYEPELTGPEYDVDKKTLTQDAVIFDYSTEMDNILEESHSIRKDMSMLNLEIHRLKIHNERYGTTVGRLTFLKRDSDSIARGIHHRAESLHNQIQNLGKECSRLEEKNGPNAAVTRIARTQYETLMCSFHEVMSDYYKIEEKQRGTCRTRLQRQASIMGAEMSEKDLNELVEKGGEGWTELSQNLCPDGGRLCRSALGNIKGRHKELLDLEARMKEVQELFLQIAILVEEQGLLVDNIQINVCKTEDYTEEANYKLVRAKAHKKKNPCLQCCPWLPCWKQSGAF